jgi:carbamoyl-phosphate synthase large subunit
MEIIYNSRELQKWLRKKHEITEDSPLLMDRFLSNAIEVDVDAICDGEEVLLVGMMEQIHEAGVHSGDSACSLPPLTLKKSIQEELERQTRLIALDLKVRGLINIQFAIEAEKIFIIEVNPRASRTVPFASKARGVPYARIAMKVMLGKKLREIEVPSGAMDLVYVKESVFPFKRFPETDIILGPEMRSTGEVMGVGKTFGEAFGKATLASGYPLPLEGTAFLSVKDADKEACLSIARELEAMGFDLVATRGTAQFLNQKGIAVRSVNKVNEGRPHIVDHIKNGEISLVVNTSALGVHEVGAAYELRRNTLMRNLCYFTTVAAAKAGVQAIAEHKRVPLSTHCLQERSI